MADDDAKYYRQDWMSADQWECARMVADLCGGWHHVSGPIRPHGVGIRCGMADHRLATFDHHLLTRAVIMAHDRCIRLELAASSPGRIGMRLWKRHTREGSIMERHPTIHEAVAKWHDETYPQPASVSAAA